MVDDEEEDFEDELSLLDEVEDDDSFDEVEVAPFDEELAPLAFVDFVEEELSELEFPLRA